MNNTYILRSVLLLLLFSLTFNSCKKEENSWELEMEELNKYLEDNNITTEATANGLYYIETSRGSGPKPNAGDVVEVEYTGTFLDGEMFDQGTFIFTLGIRQVIRGWDEGIALMKEGGEAILIIPSTLGYGIYGNTSIPPYTSLRFEVELLNIME